MVLRDRRPRRPPPAAPGGAQRRRPDRAQAAVDQDPAAHRPGVHRPQGARAAPRACTRSARRPAAPTSTSAGRTARPPSSSAATSARGAATSARSTPASRSRSTATSRAGSPSRCARWGCATRPSPASPATTSRTRAPGCTPRRSAQIHALNPGTGVELLDPRLLRRRRRCSRRSSTPRPRCFAHNVETVPRIFKRIRPGVPLRPLARGHHRRPRDAGLVTKSNLILGHGRDPRRGRSRRCATCTPPAATWSRSPSTCGRARATTRSSAGSRRRSSPTWSSRRCAMGFARRA